MCCCLAPEGWWQDTSTLFMQLIHLVQFNNAQQTGDTPFLLLIWATRSQLERPRPTRTLSEKAIRHACLTQHGKETTAAGVEGGAGIEQTAT